MRDRQFWEKNYPKLNKFYFASVLPELVDSRSARNMPLREPEEILMATEEKNYLHSSFENLFVKICSFQYYRYYFVQ